jgi:hypothetical protein
LKTKKKNKSAMPKRSNYLSDRSQLSQYRLDPIAVTRPGGCQDAGMLHCSVGNASRLSMAQVNDPVLFGRSPFRSGDSACSVEPEVARARPPRKCTDSWSNFVQHKKTSLKELDLTPYFMVPKAVPDGYRGMDVTLNRHSRMMTNIAAEEKEKACASQRTYASYATYA